MVTKIGAFLGACPDQSIPFTFGQNSVTFLKPTRIISIGICLNYDALHSCECEAFGRTRVICGLRIETTATTDYHAVHWLFQKQGKIFYSPFGVAIFATADPGD